MWKDYDLDNPSDRTVMEAPPIDRAWTAELNLIGGNNPLGKPMLEARWGATYRDPQSEDNSLKYWVANKESTLMGFGFIDPVTGMDMLVKTLAEVPGSVLAIPKYTGIIELGERRIIIEQWRSPEFLARSGRYRANMLRDPDKTYEAFYCRACDNDLMLGNDGPKPCVECGSKRHYVKTETIAGDGKLLRSFPREGAYDYFLRLENQLGEPMEPNAHALRLIEEAWHNQQTETDADRQAKVDAIIAPQRETMKIAASSRSSYYSLADGGTINPTT